MIFFQVPLTLSPVTGRRLYYTIFSVDIGVTPKTAVSLCHFNQMFHAGDCCVFKTVFSTHRHPASTVNSPAHPVSVPIRHPGDKSSAVTSLETDTYYIYIPGIQVFIANATRYQVHTRYTHACGVWVVFLEHGGGALGIFKPPVCTCNQSWTFVRFTLFIDVSFPSKRSGRLMPPAERSALYYFPITTSNINWFSNASE